MRQVDRGPFEYKQIGRGGRNIVFVNGFRVEFESWDKVYPEIAKHHRVLLFNRRGVGLSAKALADQTGDVVVSEMHDLLSSLSIEPPYLFVAHSLGGIFANLYLRTYPEEGAGLVLVDAPHPLEVAAQKMFKLPLPFRLVNDGLKILEKISDPFKYSEDESIEQTVRQIQERGLFPDLPLAVLSGTKKMPFAPSEAFELHQRFQLELLKLSSRAKHYRCDRSGHFPQITEPERVIEAIMGCEESAECRF